MPNDFSAHKGRKLEAGMKVRVYFNLRRFQFSAKAEGKVVGYARQLFLKDVNFVVQEGGRLRVLAEQQKNVHAFVEGTLFEPRPGQEAELFRCGEEVKYNPYKGDSFYRKSDNADASGGQQAWLFLDEKGHPRVYIKALRLK